MVKCSVYGVQTMQGRDSFWRKHYKITDEADPQFKQVLSDLGIKIFLCTIASEKRKDRAPLQMAAGQNYQNMCKKGIKEIEDAREVLAAEVKRYNS